MNFYDVIIVGSGPAGTAAARRLKNRNVLILDVGNRPTEDSQLNGNLFRQRKLSHDLFHSLIGENFESLYNLHNPPISLKLKSPGMRYVTQDWQKLSPIRSANFTAMHSFAQGGLANAWGAGCYRFTERDLKEFPIGVRDLEPHYRELTQHMGVCGTNDDLSPYFGCADYLQPPLKLSRLAHGFLGRYTKHRLHLNQEGIYLGYPRLAVLSKPLDNRGSYGYENLEFFKPHIPAIYNPAFALDQLLKTHTNMTYMPGQLVKTFKETNLGLTVTTTDLANNFKRVFRGKKLLLAAGALNSAKIVLASSDDQGVKLPILDNKMSCIPIFDWRIIGQGFGEFDSSLAQLNNASHRGIGMTPFSGSFCGSHGPLRTDFLFPFLPFPALNQLDLWQVSHGKNRRDHRYFMLDGYAQVKTLLPSRKMTPFTSTTRPNQQVLLRNCV